MDGARPPEREMAAMIAALDRCDLDGFLAFFDEGADLLNPVGMAFRGHAEIRALHEILFHPDPPPGYPSLAATASEGRVAQARLVAPGVAVVDWEWSSRDLRDPAQAWPPRSGRTSCVWRHGPDGWKVVAWRDADFPAEVGRPDC